MNGDLYEGLVCTSKKNNPFEVAGCDYRRLPECKTIDEIIKKERGGILPRVYQTPTKVFSAFLRRRFGKDLADFMKMYSKEHFKNLGFENVEGIVLPVGITTICYFEESQDPYKTAQKIMSHNSCIETFCGRTYLNMQIDQMYKFTLVRATFDLGKEKNLFSGYYFKSGNFRFFIKSTVQLDLTVVYQEF